LHDTAKATAEVFFQAYGEGVKKILEVGSSNVNGSLRDCGIPAGSEYLGMDICKGRGVDLVIPDPHSFPLEDETFDLVVSSSVFEHDPAFWITFWEMCRVVKPTGFIYLSAPASGLYHTYPIDAWRFFPDAGVALADWSRKSQYPRQLVESFQLPPRDDKWTDFVAVFGDPELAAQRIVDQFPEAQYVRPQKAP
jgi:SAM-dependent methyltransferase